MAAAAAASDGGDQGGGGEGPGLKEKGVPPALREAQAKRCRARSGGRRR